MKTKRLLAILLALVMLLSLTACGGTDETTETQAPAGGNETAAAEEAPQELSGEITFWHCFTQGARMEAIEAAAATFMEANPGVTINIETMSWGDFNTKWNAGLTTGDLPDISVAQNTGEVAEMINAGVLADISPVIDAIGRDRFSENALGDMTTDGVTYGVPYYSHAQVM